MDNEEPGSLTLQPPHGPKKELTSDHWPFRYNDTHAPGVYRLTTPGGKTVYYVVQPDTHDGDDLTSATEEDRTAVSDILPISYEDDARSILKSPGQPIQLWWLLLIGLIGLLCIEVWLTRRIAKNR